MSWFIRKSAGIKTKTSQQIEVPDGQWVKCTGCSETVNRREIERNQLVCPKCAYHFKMSSIGYFDLLFDDGAYELYDQNLVPTDPLLFTDRKPYADRLRQTREKTGLTDAARSATGAG